MGTDLRLPVVVGVDGTDQSTRALRYAVREAQRHDCGIHIVHAVHETAPVAPMLPLVSMETFDEVGRRIVTDAARYVHGIDPSVPVETSVLHGTRTRVVADVGENARMIVLGHRDRALLGRVLTSSTTTGVGARAHCPVVSVPSTWVDGQVHGRVVVGVDGSAASKDALGLAFSAAAERGASLTVLHAWKLPSAYDDIIASRVMVDEWRRTGQTEMEQTVAPWREIYPEVDVEIDLRHQYPAPALVGATEGADLVVVGRRGHGAPLGLYLGSVARTLIREARCPVEIAPQHMREETPPAARVSDSEVSPQA